MIVQKKQILVQYNIIYVQNVTGKKEFKTRENGARHLIYQKYDQILVRNNIYFKCRKCHAFCSPIVQKCDSCLKGIVCYNKCPFINEIYCPNCKINLMIN